MAQQPAIVVEPISSDEESWVYLDDEEESERVKEIELEERVEEINEEEQGVQKAAHSFLQDSDSDDDFFGGSGYVRTSYSSPIRGDEIDGTCLIANNRPLPTPVPAGIAQSSKLNRERAMAIAKEKQAIENAIASKNQAIASKNQAIASKNQAIAIKNQAIASKNQAIASKKQAIPKPSIIGDVISFLERLNKFFASTYLGQVFLLFVTIVSLASYGIIYYRYTNMAIAFEKLNDKYLSLQETSIRLNIQLTEKAERTSQFDESNGKDSVIPSRLDHLGQPVWTGNDEPVRPSQHLIYDPIEEFEREMEELVREHELERKLALEREQELERIRKCDRDHISCGKVQRSMDMYSVNKKHKPMDKCPFGNEKKDKHHKEHKDHKYDNRFKKFEDKPVVGHKHHRYDD